MRITVTEEHIRKGAKFLPCLCPIALAIEQQTGLEASAGPYEVDLYGAHSHRSVELPADARGFMIRFDRGEPVKPFSFDLPVYGEGLTEGSAAHPQVDESH